MPCEAFADVRNATEATSRSIYSSSSSSTLTLLSVAGAVEDVVGAEGVSEPMTEPRAALRLCVAASFSLLLPWSTLGRAFFRGLPTRASGATSAALLLLAVPPGVALGAVVFTEGSDATGCSAASGVVEVVSGSAE